MPTGMLIGVGASLRCEIFPCDLNATVTFYCDRREEAHRRRQPDRGVLLAADSGDPAEPACRRAEQAQVRAALAALPIAQRQAIALAYYGGHSRQEIAVLTDTPVGTAKTRMRTGMRTLRGRLTADHGPAQRVATPSA